VGSTDQNVILNVDDNEAGRYVTTKILRKAGYEVVEAASGAEALAQAAGPVSLVLLDIHLPDITGYEVCRRLKADPATAGLPVIYLSATADDVEVRERGEGTGACMSLFAPLPPDELLAAVRRALGDDAASG
jgi:CheY-like chemotaxis protein